MDARSRRCVVLAAGLRAVVAVTTPMVIHALLPHGAVVEDTAVDSWIVGVVLFSALATWQVWRVLNDRFPRVRAAEPLAVGFAVAVVGFATTENPFHTGRHDRLLAASHLGAVSFVGAMPVGSTPSLRL